jgi:hypothetical protein
MLLNDVDYSKLTVTDLRARVREYYPTTAPKGLSKLRKSDVIEFLQAKRDELLAAKEQEHREQYERDNAAAGKAADAMLAGAIYAAGTETEPTVEEWQQLNHAKYLGRYHANRVQVRSMGRHVAGRVMEMVLRDRDLLLVVQHTDQAEVRHGEEIWSPLPAGVPRRTLHRAEDVALTA